MWFSFDGIDFATHDTELQARQAAEEAMEQWQDDADDGWDECSTKVCYGRVTHAVRVEPIEITDENRHLMHPDVTGLEKHHLEPVEEE